MERKKKTLLLSLLCALLHVCPGKMDDCPISTDNDLSCYNDYNRIITCVWNSTNVTDAECTIDAKKKTRLTNKFTHRTCKLEPTDVSKPRLKTCVMDIGKDKAFQSFEYWAIELKCDSMNQRLKMDFRPFCNIKLNPSGEPHVNSTTVSWSPQANPHYLKTFPGFSYKSELQWNLEKVSDPSVQSKIKDCDLTCEAELDPDLFFLGETYEARTRVQFLEFGNSTWSDWSPTTTWVSTIGKPKPAPDVAGCVLAMIVAGTVALALLVAVMLYKSDKNWVYIVKKIKGPPIPNPARSFLKDVHFQSWLSPHFSGNTCHSFIKQAEILSVEVTSTLDSVAPCKLEAALLEKIRSEGSSSSSYSNPSYSQLCLAPPISSLTSGNLQACAADTPYGPVGNQCKGENAEVNKEEEKRKEMEIFDLLSKGSRSSEAVQVISDYEKVEKPQLERMRLQSLDSGVCSAEEVSEESLEGDSINVSDGHEEEPEDNEEPEEERENARNVNFKTLFGGTGCIFGKGSIQVCSDYERVQRLQVDSPELPSVDSGVSSGGEEQLSQEESPDSADKSTESTRFLFPSPSSPLPHSFASFSPPPPKFPGPGLSPQLPSLPAHLLARIALLPTSRSVEPSCDGYMPVKQEVS
ncbi:hypothetical protein Q5P01_025594 [Channa striata]|uniref:Interleukin-2 receptor subunit beta N-terminal domain-containing protein n=1 Tax=Channa striata TaxID=64152 RepID=A0AA88IR54_CHASR|nr:hypothetical protein Q5P01_025594 [Channa striata]